MEYSFSIADYHFSLGCPDAVHPPENFLKFCSEPEKGAYRYRLLLTEELPAPTGRMAARRDDILVFRDGSLETRYLRFHGMPEQDAFACCREEDAGSSTIFLRSSVLDDLSYDTVFTSLFSLERHMIERNALILHSAYIRFQGKAILFSAPSGTGKSTQAGLWEEYRSAEQLNGDRSLLRKISGVWHACGWPVCGSSEICNNADTPLCAIVMLSQGKSNEISRLAPMAAFSQLYTQITINRWNRDYLTRAMDEIETLVREIPIYHLSCTISEGAVNCLEQALQQGL